MNKIAIFTRSGSFSLAAVSNSAMDRSHKAKLSKYEEVRKEWEGTNLVFQPMVFSHEGRMHHHTARVLHYVSGRVAQKYGVATKQVEERWRREIGTALAIRRARMFRRCLPRLNARDWFVVHGDGGDDDDMGLGYPDDDDPGPSLAAIATDWRAILGGA